MQMTMNRWGGVFVLATLILGLAKPLAETEAPAKPEADAPSAEAKQAALFKQFEKTLTNAEMTGQFTLVGKEVPPIKESYTIHSVKKMSQAITGFSPRASSTAKRTSPCRCRCRSSGRATSR